jgi:hypothetical protein
VIESLFHVGIVASGVMIIGYCQSEDPYSYNLLIAQFDIQSGEILQKFEFPEFFDSNDERKPELYHYYLPAR